MVEIINDNLQVNGNVGINSTFSEKDILKIRGLNLIKRNLNNSRNVLLTGGDYNTGQALLGIDGAGFGQKFYIESYAGGTTKNFDKPSSIILNSNGGNVGIGNSAPTQKLDVNGNIKTNSQLITQKIGIGKQTTEILEISGLNLIKRNLNNSNKVLLTGGDYNTGQALLGIDGAGFGQKFYIESYAGGTTKNFDKPSSIILNSNGGNVGIGNSAPTQKLDVAGNINFTGDLLNNGIPVVFEGGQALLNDPTFINELNNKLEEERNINEIISLACSSINAELQGGGRFTCSGSFITLDPSDLQFGLFMTAAHCVMENSNVVNKFFITNPITGNFVSIPNTNIYWDGIGDIALVKTNIDFTNNSTIPLKLSSINPKTGDSCVLCGNPAGVDNKSYASGVVRDAEMYDNGGYQVPPTLFIDTAGTGGNSGSPVLNANGEIIGIFTFGFTNYETLGGGANLSVLNRSLPVLKDLALANSTEKRFITKFYLGLDYYTPSTFPFILENIYGTSDFPNQGVIIYNVNTTLSPFTGILNNNDIWLSFTINGSEYPLGVTPGQYAPGFLIYQTEPNIQIKYLDQSDSYTQKIVNITLVTYQGIPDAFDQPLSTAFSDSGRSNNYKIEKSKLILARNK